MSDFDGMSYLEKSPRTRVERRDKPDDAGERKTRKGRHFSEDDKGVQGDIDDYLIERGSQARPSYLSNPQPETDKADEFDLAELAAAMDIPEEDERPLTAEEATALGKEIQAEIYGDSSGSETKPAVEETRPEEFPEPNADTEPLPGEQSAAGKEAEPEGGVVVRTGGAAEAQRPSSNKGADTAKERATGEEQGKNTKKPQDRRGNMFRTSHDRAKAQRDESGVHTEVRKEDEAETGYALYKKLRDNAKTFDQLIVAIKKVEELPATATRTTPTPRDEALAAVATIQTLVTGLKEKPHDAKEQVRKAVAQHVPPVGLLRPTITNIAINVLNRRFKYGGEEKGPETDTPPTSGDERSGQEAASWDAVRDQLVAVEYVEGQDDAYLQGLRRVFENIANDTVMVGSDPMSRDTIIQLFSSLEDATRTGLHIPEHAGKMFGTQYFPLPPLIRDNIDLILDHARANAGVLEKGSKESETTAGEDLARADASTGESATAVPVEQGGEAASSSDEGANETSNGAEDELKPFRPLSESPERSGQVDEKASDPLERETAAAPTPAPSLDTVEKKEDSPIVEAKLEREDRTPEQEHEHFSAAQKLMSGVAYADGVDLIDYIELLQDELAARAVEDFRYHTVEDSSTVYTKVKLDGWLEAFKDKLDTKARSKVTGYGGGAAKLFGKPLAHFLPNDVQERILARVKDGKIEAFEVAVSDEDGQGGGPKNEEAREGEPVQGTSEPKVGDVLGEAGEPDAGAQADAKVKTSSGDEGAPPSIDEWATQFETTCRFATTLAQLRQKVLEQKELYDAAGNQVPQQAFLDAITRTKESIIESRQGAVDIRTTTARGDWLDGAPDSFGFREALVRIARTRILSDPSRTEERIERMNVRAESKEAKEVYQEARKVRHELTDQLKKKQQAYFEAMTAYHTELNTTNILKFVFKGKGTELKRKVEELEKEYDLLLNKVRDGREERINTFRTMIEAKRRERAQEQGDEYKGVDEEARAAAYVTKHEAVLERQIDQESIMVENLRLSSKESTEPQWRIMQESKALYASYRALPPLKKIRYGIYIAGGVGAVAGATGVVAGGTLAVAGAFSLRRAVGGTVGMGAAIGTKLGADTWIKRTEKKALTQASEKMTGQETTLAESRKERKEVRSRARNSKRGSTIAAAGVGFLTGMGAKDAVGQWIDAPEDAPAPAKKPEISAETEQPVTPLEKVQDDVHVKQADELPPPDAEAEGVDTDNTEEVPDSEGKVIEAANGAFPEKLPITATYQEGDRPSTLLDKVMSDSGKESPWHSLSEPERAALAARIAQELANDPTQNTNLGVPLGDWNAFPKPGTQLNLELHGAQLDRLAEEVRGMSPEQREALTQYPAAAEVSPVPEPRASGAADAEQAATKERAEPVYELLRSVGIDLKDKFFMADPDTSGVAYVANETPNGTQWQMLAENGGVTSVQSSQIPEAVLSQHDAQFTEASSASGVSAVPESGLAEKGYVFKNGEFTMADPDNPRAAYIATKNDSGQVVWRHVDGKFDNTIMPEVVPDSVRSVMRSTFENPGAAANAEVEAPAPPKPEGAKVPEAARVPQEAPAPAAEPIGAEKGAGPETNAEHLHFEGTYKSGESVQGVLNTYLANEFTEFGDTERGRVAHLVQQTLEKENDPAKAAAYREMFGVGKDGNWDVVQKGGAYDVTLDRSMMFDILKGGPELAGANIDVVPASGETLTGILEEQAKEWGIADDKQAEAVQEMLKHVDKNVKQYGDYGLGKSVDDIDEGKRLQLAIPDTILEKYGVDVAAQNVSKLLEEAQQQSVENEFTKAEAPHTMAVAAPETLPTNTSDPFYTQAATDFTPEKLLGDKLEKFEGLKPSVPLKHFQTVVTQDADIVQDPKVPTIELMHDSFAAISYADVASLYDAESGQQFMHPELYKGDVTLGESGERVLRGILTNLETKHGAWVHTWIEETANNGSNFGQLLERISSTLDHMKAEGGVADATQQEVDNPAAFKPEQLEKYREALNDALLFQLAKDPQYEAETMESYPGYTRADRPQVAAHMLDKMIANGEITPGGDMPKITTGDVQEAMREMYPATEEVATRAVVSEDIPEKQLDVHKGLTARPYSNLPPGVQVYANEFGVINKSCVYGPQTEYPTATRALDEFLTRHTEGLTDVERGEVRNYLLEQPGNTHNIGGGKFVVGTNELVSALNAVIERTEDSAVPEAQEVASSPVRADVAQAPETPPQEAPQMAPQSELERLRAEQAAAAERLAAVNERMEKVLAGTVTGGDSAPTAVPEETDPASETPDGYGGPGNPSPEERFRMREENIKTVHEIAENVTRELDPPTEVPDEKSLGEVRDARAEVAQAESEVQAMRSTLSSKDEGGEGKPGEQVPDSKEQPAQISDEGITDASEDDPYTLADPRKPEIPSIGDTADPERTSTEHVLDTHEQENAAEAPLAKDKPLAEQVRSKDFPYMINRVENAATKIVIPEGNAPSETLALFKGLLYETGKFESVWTYKDELADSWDALGQIRIDDLYNEDVKTEYQLENGKTWTLSPDTEAFLRGFLTELETSTKEVGVQSIIDEIQEKNGTMSELVKEVCKMRTINNQGLPAAAP